ncbi:hypothetical protein [Streptomyces paromomycinus]|uniref:Uncharacterized protein n=1 Tax=Streptomyces paromomycinus TaxID=92743 RepID=A0A401VTL1_STREY|nr:hypothetical protein [Streptomyces paromomycinus]GCD40416.1 hypothetical protein GKJPGBOP_00065 [Streptomyces paromomycinus]
MTIPSYRIDVRPCIPVRLPDAPSCALGLRDVLCRAHQMTDPLGAGRGKGADVQDENCQGRPPQDRTSHTAGAPAAAAPQEQASLRQLEADLAAASREDEDARARRRQADAALVEYLRRQDFTGPQYQTVIQGLMEYSWRTLSHWSATGTIFERSARMGRPVPQHKVVASWHERGRSHRCADR